MEYTEEERVKSKILTTLGSVALFAAILLWHYQNDRDEPTPLTPAGGAVSKGEFAASFSGTQADGQFRLVGEHLQIDGRILEFFDYYLGAQGERTLADIRKQIEIELDHSLPGIAASEAKQLLQQYINYRRALVTLDKEQRQNTDLVASLRTRLQLVRATRERFFSPDQCRALFGAQQLDEEQALARLEVQQDAGLSPEQKTARLAQLDAQLPPEQRQLRQAPIQHALLEQEVQAARRNGAGESQIYQIRAQKLGSEAAERLASVDKEEEQWRSRIDSYLAERKTLLNDANLPASQREAEIQRLRSQRFNNTEQLRLAAYEEGDK